MTIEPWFPKQTRVQLTFTVLWLMGLAPWIAAWRVNRAWSVIHGLYWALLAWMGWGYAICMAGGPDALRIALCLSGGAGVAMLGARRPHLMAWNFVVLGLLGVMILPMIEAWLLGVSSIDGLRRLFLIVTLAIGILNYVPTQLGLGALSLAVGCGLYLYESLGGAQIPEPLAAWAVLLSPWFAWLGTFLPAPADPLDRTWHAFRDRLGLVWGQRTLEQFNASARHRGWPVQLEWRGMRFSAQVSNEARAEIGAALDALLSRFKPV